jgi:hypothetical protein
MAILSTEAEVQNSISSRDRVLKQFDAESLSLSFVLNTCREQKTRGKRMKQQCVPDSVLEFNTGVGYFINRNSLSLVVSSG